MWPRFLRFWLLLQALSIVVATGPAVAEIIRLTFNGPKPAQRFADRVFGRNQRSWFGFLEHTTCPTHSRFVSFFHDGLPPEANGSFMVPDELRCESYYGDHVTLLILWAAVALSLSVLTFALVVLWYGCTVGLMGLARYVTSWVLHHGAQELGGRRAAFRKQPLPRAGLSSSHTHPNSAAERSSVDGFVSMLAAELRLAPYYVQKAPRDGDRSGSSVAYWMKDTLVEPSVYAPPANSLAVLIDVDYHLEDIGNFLSTCARTVLLYTIMPNNAAGTGECNYTFDADSNIVFTVSGGTEHVHRIWNWSGDNYVTWSWSWRGVVVRTWYVDSRQLNGIRRMVFLNCATEHSGLSGLWAWAAYQSGYVSGGRITRLDTSHEGVEVVEGVAVPAFFTRLRIVEQDAVYVATARAGEYASFKVRADYDSAIKEIAHQARKGKSNLSVFHVQRYVSDEPVLEPAEHAACWAMVAYHNSTAVHKEADYVANAVRNRGVFDWGVRSDPSSEPAEVEFMKPIIEGILQPNMSPTNEEEAVEERIERVAVEKLEVSTDIMTLMQEFVDQFVPAGMRNKLSPVDIEKVFEKQARPSQRRILQEALLDPSEPNTTDPFLKKETYGEFKPPRVISPVKGGQKLKYSQYIYAVNDYLTSHSDCGRPGVWGGRRNTWYAFGLTPKEIAAIVAEMAQLTKGVWVDSDFSKMDGRVSNLMRILERLILIALFREEFHAEAERLQKKSYGLRGNTKSGRSYKTLFSRLSGSPETAVFNTIINAFVAFLARRRQGYEPAACWQKMGLYGGDDGATVDIDPTALVEAAAEVGQKMTQSIVRRGEFGVTFLARVYGPDVWYGDPSSMCDVVRQLQKFHLTVHLPSGITPAMKLVEKCRALVLSDANTPIMGPLCRKVVALGIKSAVHDDIRRQLINWWQLIHGEPDEQYPNDVAAWADGFVEETLSKFGFDKTKFCGKLEACSALQHVLNIGLCGSGYHAPAPEKPVVFEGDVLVPTGHSQRNCFPQVKTDQINYGAAVIAPGHGLSGEWRPTRVGRGLIFPGMGRDGASRRGGIQEERCVSGTETDDAKGKEEAFIEPPDVVETTERPAGCDSQRSPRESITSSGGPSGGLEQGNYGAK